MGPLRTVGSLGVAGLLWLGAPTPPAWAQAAADTPTPRKSVYGTLESVNTSQNGVFMRADGGERLAWRFPAAVVAAVAEFKPGDPMIVIYRQLTPSEKRVTAVAFPGAAPKALYVNLTGSRVMLRSAPDVGGVCGQPGAGPVTESMIPNGGRGEAGEACWCCARQDESCTPGNKTGQGKALLVSCFE